jgi:branched-chain amino acid transport system ATP-binding protein
MAILLVEHDTAMVLRISDRVTVMAEGRIIADGSPDEISKSAEVEAIYLGGGTAGSLGRTGG